MSTISVNYTLKWHIKDTSYYVTTCKKVVDAKSGRIKKKCVNGGVVGYWIGITPLNINKHEVNTL